MTDVNVKVELQKYLKDNGWYDGKLDGKIGKGSLDGIDELLSDRGLPANWSKSRKILAAEQIIYKNQKLEVGKVDGLLGPLTEYARQQYEANLVTTWRDKTEEIVQSEEPTKTKQTSTLWPKQSECTIFYGKTGSNQAKCELPFEMVLAWDPKSKLTSYSCHKKVKEPMERIWQRTFDAYGYEKIKELQLHYFGGCLNVRRIRGGSGWSMHSWGIAVDIDPDRNSLHTSWKKSQMSKAPYKKFVGFWYDEGAINLGIERNYDPMHFQFANL